MVQLAIKKKLKYYRRISLLNFFFSEGYRLHLNGICNNQWYVISITEHTRVDFTYSKRKSHLHGNYMFHKV